MKQHARRNRQQRLKRAKREEIRLRRKRWGLSPLQGFFHSQIALELVAEHMARIGKLFASQILEMFGDIAKGVYFEDVRPVDPLAGGPEGPLQEHQGSGAGPTGNPPVQA